MDRTTALAGTFGKLGTTFRSGGRALLAATVVAAIAAAQALPALAVNDPQLVSTSPEDGATVSAAGAATVSATYDRDLTPPPDSGLVLRDTIGTQVAGAVTLSGDSRSIVFTPAEPLPTAGSPYTATVTAAPAAGGDSTADTFTFSVDGTPPGPPVIDSPAPDSFVPGDVHVTGTAEPGSTVRVYEGASQVGDAAETADGTFDIVLPYGSENGTLHTITATATDGPGNAGAASDPITFTHDNVAPGAPVITDPAGDVTTATPSATLSGSAEDGDVVVYDDGTEVATTTAGGGVWTVTVPEDPGAELADGPHPFTARARDAAGNLSGPSSTRTVTVDTEAPPAPTIQTSPSSPIGAADIADVTVFGTTEAGSAIEVSVDDADETTLAVEDTTTADTEGDYSVEGLDLSGLDDGPLTITVTSTDAVGHATTATATIAKDTDAPGTPVVEVAPAVVNAGNQDAVTVSGGGGGDGAVAVHITVASSGGGDSYEPAPVPLSDTGGYSHTFDASALTDGTLTVTVFSTDAAGNESDEAIDTALKDATAPDAPTIVAPADGAEVGSTDVVATGTAEPNALVEVSEDGAPLGAGTADGAGDWSVDITVTGDGFHTISVVQTDEHDNPGTDAAERTFLVNTAAPAFVSSDPAGGSSHQAVTAVSATYDEVLESGTLQVRNAVGTLVAGPAPTVDGSTIAFTPTGGALLPAGSPYTAKTTGTDHGGSTSAETTFTFTVDNVAPTAPAITSPAEGAVIPDEPAAVAGTAEAGTTVTVIEDGATVATAITDEDGNWSATAGLDEGEHTITATATDAAGNVSGASAERTFTVATAPAAPVVDTPEEGADLDEGTAVPITGTAEPGSTVTVIEDGATVAEATADEDGSWSTEADFDEGDHTITATATDAAGNVSAASAERTFTVNMPPAAPVIVSPAEGAALNTTTVTISGTAEPGSTVTVEEGPSTVGTPATANAGGNWSVTGTFAPGSHTVNATATDAAGKTGPTSANRTFTVDVVAPGTPTITSPEHNAIVNTSTVTISGFGSESGSTIVVREGATTIATATVTSGTWTTTSVPLADGPHTIRASARDAAGNESGASAGRLFTVDTTAPNPPVITTPAEGAILGSSTVVLSGTAEPRAFVTVRESTPGGTTTIAVVQATSAGQWSVEHTFADGQHTIRATARDAAGNEGDPSLPRTFTVDTRKPNPPVITTPAAGTTVGSPVSITGSAQPGTAVTVREGETVVGTATASSETGAWSMSKVMADGPHVIAATARDAAGNESDASGDRPFTVDATPPAAPVITTPAEGATVFTTSVRIAGTAEAGSTVTVRDGATGLGTAPTGEDGTWSLTATLTAGEHTVTATAADAVGNVSPPSSPPLHFTVTPDAEKPAPPVILEPGAGSFKPAAVAVSGTAEDGATVEVVEGVTSLGTTTADEDGDWSLNLTFASGSHTIAATATDAAGNESDPSSPHTFSVDADAPTATIAAPSTPVFGPNDPVTITGTASDAGGVQRVEVTFAPATGTPTTVVATLTPGSSGTVAWSATATGLQAGPYTVTARATDTVGNAGSSPPTTIVTFGAVPAVPSVSPSLPA